MASKTVIRPVTGQVGFVFLVGKSPDYRDVTLFSKCFRPHENEKPTFSNPSGLRSVFELVRTVGLTVEIEWFSFECRKTKTKVITLANHKEHRQYSEPIKI